MIEKQKHKVQNIGGGTLRLLHPGRLEIHHFPSLLWKGIGLRSTLTDIAREAGVSSATVDRVLNNRNGVKERPREVVIETAPRLGVGVLPGSSLPFPSSTNQIRLDFVLPAGTNTFIANLLAHLERRAE